MTIPIPAAASRLGVSRATLRRWIRKGAPVAHRGRRGRGGQTLIDVAAISAWRASRSPCGPDDRLQAFASRIPELLADAVLRTFVAVEGPHKRASAAVLAAAWYASTLALLDALRAEGLDLEDPRTLPEKIAHLRAI